MKMFSARKAYILSFIIPVIVMIAVFSILGIWPFGGNTIMTGDTTYQFVDYLSYYKTILFGNNDFSYSLSKNMGGEMAGFAAYYLFSPLNLLTLPFSRENLFQGIALIIALSPGFASLSMFHTLRQLKKADYSALILSLCYGLSAYIIVYNELLYYYTNYILLPLIFLFFRRMIENRKQIEPGYIILLAFSVINNYYTGYMICIFLLIYCIYYLIFIYEEKARFKAFIIFAGNSVLAVLLSCFTLIPAVMSLSGEKDNLSVGFFVTFPPLNLFSKLYSGSFAGDFGAGMPNIYCGVLVILLLILVILDKEKSLKRRIGISLILFFFWIDFCINTLNVIWHGLNQPIGFPYRQAFLVIFFGIITVYEDTDLSSLKLERKKAVLIIGVFGLYSVFLVIRRIDNTDMLSIMITAIVYIALIFAFFLPVKFRSVVLAIITIADLSFNAGYSLSHFYLTTVAEYREPLSLILNAEENVKEQGEDDVFRVEKTFRRTNNDAMMCDYAGLTHFSSSEKKKTMAFMGSLGFRDNENWAMYSSTNTALADAILGVRYLLSQHDSTGKPYNCIYSDPDGEYFIYENPYANPIMSAVDKKVFDVTLSEDPFENQNMIADSMNGKSNDILHLQKADRKDNEDGSVSYEISIENNGNLYGFISAPYIQEAVLYNDGDEWGEYFSVYNWSVTDLEDRKKGDTVRIDVKPQNDPLKVGEAYFAIIDNDNLIKWSDDVKKEETSLYKETSSVYKGSYDSEKGVILFSLPADKGWHLFVDGKEYELTEACGHLIAAEVPFGHHEVELRFISPGKMTGLIISSVTLFLLIIYCVFLKFRPQYFDQMIHKK